MEDYQEAWLRSYVEKTSIVCESEGERGGQRVRKKKRDRERERDREEGRRGSSMIS